LNTIKKKLSEKIFDYFNAIIMIILCITFVYPLLYIIFASFSDPARLSLHRGLLTAPLGFTTLCYTTIAKHPLLLRAYANTLFYVTVGTALNMLFTTLAAYVLSRRDFLYSKFIMKMVVLTMFLSGGLIPFWILLRDLGFYNTIWAMLIPGLINPWNMIIMRNAFMQVPASLEESARIDGASHLRVLWDVIVPLTTPTIAVMILFFGVGRWNSWFDGAMFLKNRNLFPLQLIMREILIQNQISDVVNVNDVETSQISTTIKYAAITVSTIPILCIYPFLQKYFVTGLMLGAVKG
jgi:putative aldouronate transport system permease protein